MLLEADHIFSRFRYLSDLINKLNANSLLWESICLFERILNRFLEIYVNILFIYFVFINTGKLTYFYAECFKRK